jgi:hypothetical protein
MILQALQSLYGIDSVKMILIREEDNFIRQADGDYW